MYFHDLKVCVLDIETTGLSPERSHFVLGGLLTIEDGESQLKQYFAESLSEEKEILSEYINEAIKSDMILTFNGKNFDIPFLLSRADKLELGTFNFPYNLDLYLVLNGHSSLRKLLPNLKQKTIEDFMGLWPYRNDKISGADSAMLYMKYLQLRENFEDTKECEDLMLLHNKDDVLQLGKLLPVLEKADFHKAMYSLGFPIISKATKLLVKNIRFERNELIVSGTQISSPLEYVSYQCDSKGYFTTAKNSEPTFGFLFPLIKTSDLLVLDLTKLPVDICSHFSKFPNFESGYLVLKQQNDIKYMTVNYFIKTFLTKLLEDIS